jgi:hypothetical protein
MASQGVKSFPNLVFPLIYPIPLDKLPEKIVAA